MDNRALSSENPKPKSPQGENSANARKDRKRQEAEKRRQLQPLRSRLKQLEQLVEQLTTKQKEFEQELTSQEIYDEDNKDRLKQLLADKSSVDRELASAEEEWLSTEEKLEELGNQQPE
jgi:ATP-binding cassette subfamily F protein 3